ncbi:MAG: NTP transferase domain-containing protein [Bacteroidetes bacterium]|nr:NTP transferase domain-containing protein [Bacteroidota bacterium]
MKGVVLAGGTGSRLFPLTKVTNKHLLPVGRYPMIYHPIMRLKRVGCTEIAIVTSPEHMGDVVNLLGSGFRFGVDFTYRVQDQSGGIAQAMGLCENFTGSDSFIVMLGDNILADDFPIDVIEFMSGSTTIAGKAHVLLKQVPDPERYGVPRLLDDTIVEVIEKPTHPPSNYSVIGVYLFDPKVYDIIRTLEPSDRGELEISDVISHYAQTKTLSHGVVRGWWGDAGTLEGYQEANSLAKDLVYEEIPVSE